MNEQLPYPWRMDFDPSSGRPYYINIETGEVSWCRPGEVWSISWDNHTTAQYWIDRNGNTAPLESPAIPENSVVLLPTPTPGGIVSLRDSGKAVTQRAVQNRRSASGRLDWFSTNKDKIIDQNQERERLMNQQNHEYAVYTRQEEMRFQQQVVQKSLKKPIVRTDSAISPSSMSSATNLNKAVTSRKNGGMDRNPSSMSIEHVYSNTSIQGLRTSSRHQTGDPPKLDLSQMSSAMIPQRKSGTPRKVGDSDSSNSNSIRNPGDDSSPTNVGSMLNESTGYTREGNATSQENITPKGGGTPRNIGTPRSQTPIQGNTPRDAAPLTEDTTSQGTPRATRSRGGTPRKTQRTTPRTSRGSVSHNYVRSTPVPPAQQHSEGPAVKLPSAADIPSSTALKKQRTPRIKPEISGIASNVSGIPSMTSGLQSPAGGSAASSQNPQPTTPSGQGPTTPPGETPFMQNQMVTTNERSCPSSTSPPLLPNTGTPVANQQQYQYHLGQVQYYSTQPQYNQVQYDPNQQQYDENEPKFDPDLDEYDPDPDMGAYRANQQQQYDANQQQQYDSNQYAYNPNQQGPYSQSQYQYDSNQQQQYNQQHDATQCHQYDTNQEYDQQCDPNSGQYQQQYDPNFASDPNHQQHCNQYEQQYGGYQHPPQYAPNQPQYAPSQPQYFTPDPQQYNQNQGDPQPHYLPQQGPPQQFQKGAPQQQFQQGPPHQFQPGMKGALQLSYSSSAPVQTIPKKNKTPFYQSAIASRRSNNMPPTLVSPFLGAPPPPPNGLHSAPSGAYHSISLSHANPVGAPPVHRDPGPPPSYSYPRVEANFPRKDFSTSSTTMTERRRNSPPTILDPFGGSGMPAPVSQAPLEIVDAPPIDDESPIGGPPIYVALGGAPPIGGPPRTTPPSGHAVPPLGVPSIVQYSTSMASSASSCSLYLGVGSASAGSSQNLITLPPAPEVGPPPTGPPPGKSAAIAKRAKPYSVSSLYKKAPGQPSSQTERSVPKSGASLSVEDESQVAESALPPAPNAASLPRSTIPRGKHSAEPSLPPSVTESKVVAISTGARLMTTSSAEPAETPTIPPATSGAPAIPPAVPSPVGNANGTGTVSNADIASGTAPVPKEYMNAQYAEQDGDEDNIKKLVKTAQEMKGNLVEALVDGYRSLKTSDAPDVEPHRGAQYADMYEAPPMTYQTAEQVPPRNENGLNTAQSGTANLAKDFQNANQEEAPERAPLQQKVINGVDYLFSAFNSLTRSKPVAEPKVKGASRTKGTGGVP